MVQMAERKGDETQLILFVTNVKNQTKDAQP